MSGGGEKKKEERERGGEDKGKEGEERGKEDRKRKRNINNKWSVHGLITGLKSTLVMFSASTLVTVCSVM